jgi:hypothetical protein
MALRLIRDRPGDPAFCDTIVSSKLSPLANLTPASGRQTQTISPYARTTLVSRCLTSIASLPRVCDDGLRPLCGTGWLDFYFGFSDMASGLFFSVWLDIIYDNQK